MSAIWLKSILAQMKTPKKTYTSSIKLVSVLYKYAEAERRSNI